MPFRKISDDVKFAAIRLYENDYLPLQTILECCDFSKRTFFRILKLYRTTGRVSKPPSVNRGRPRTLHKDDIEYLLTLIRLKPDYFLDELLDLLSTNRLVSLHFTTIYRELERCNISLKKLRKIAEERNDEARALFQIEMAFYEPEQLGFMDEVSKDERTVLRRYGRAKKGCDAVKSGVFIRGRRLSAEGLLTLNGMAVSLVVEGSMTKELFLEFLENSVVCTIILSRHKLVFSYKIFILLQMPLCSPFPGPLSVLVMDNARIHHGYEITQIADRFGMYLQSRCSINLTILMNRSSYYLSSTIFT